MKLIYTETPAQRFNFWLICKIYRNMSPLTISALKACFFFVPIIYITLVLRGFLFILRVLRGINFLGFTRGVQI